MAKTPKAKKKATSTHSRAARRAGSPSMNIGDIPADTSETSQSKTTYTPYHITSEANSRSGIRKRKSALSRNQRLRRKKGVERADATSAKVEIKKQKSVDKLKAVKERAKDWEDVNLKGSGKRKMNGDSTNGFSVLGGMDIDDEKDSMMLAEQALPIRQADEPVMDALQHEEAQQSADDDI